MLRTNDILLSSI